MTRVDIELVARGLAPSRTAAQRLIADGAVFTAPRQRIERPSQQVSALDDLWVTDSDEVRYVSRAGAKLEHALRDTGIDASGRVALDLGMSTGGFADCLLQAGAQRVVGIEVGHDQLHPRLKRDPRVTCLERTNLRDMTWPRLMQQVPDAPPKGFDLAVADLSFISLGKVLPAIAAMLAPQASVLLLVKPQFELGPEALDRRGIVADAAKARSAADRVAQQCAALGWSVQGIHDSAVPGSDGNREFFIHALTAAQSPRVSGHHTESA